MVKIVPVLNCAKPFVDGLDPVVDNGYSFVEYIDPVFDEMSPIVDYGNTDADDGNLPV